MRTIKKLWLDTILGTIFIFGLMGAFSSMSAFKIFDIFDPIADALGDYQVTDIVFSQFREDPIADERILLVNIGQESRGSIGIMVDKINQFNPLVIGMDTFFSSPKDTLEDMILSDALNNVDNLVMVNHMIVNDDNVIESINRSDPMFRVKADSAHANLDSESAHQEDLKFCRQFWPRRADSLGTEQVAFGIKLASYIDPERAQKYLDRGNDIELINFEGNIIDFGATKYEFKYTALDVEDVFNEYFTPDMVEGRIVIFCYLGNILGDRSSTEDKYITPLNASYAGRTLPDMYGGVIHANIISMVLNDDPIDVLGDTGKWLAAVFLCLINVFLFSIVYKRIPKWYDGSTKLFQLVELLVFYFMMIQIFDQYSYYMDLSIALIAIALSGDALEVYYGVIKNVFTREGRRSLFRADKL